MSRCNAGPHACAGGGWSDADNSLYRDDTTVRFAADTTSRFLPRVRLRTSSSVRKSTHEQDRPYDLLSSNERVRLAPRLSDDSKADRVTLHFEVNRVSRAERIREPNLRLSTARTVQSTRQAMAHLRLLVASSYLATHQERAHSDPVLARSFRGRYQSATYARYRHL